MAYTFIYRGEYAHIIGDLKAGLLFSYLLSYIVFKNRHAEKQYKDGKIVFTYEKINADTGLNRKEINKAIQILNKQNLIEAKKNINKGITEINIKMRKTLRIRYKMKSILTILIFILILILIFCLIKGW